MTLRLFLLLSCVAITSSIPVDNKLQGQPDCSGLNAGALLESPTNCDKYYICNHGMAVLMSCPVGTWFDKNLNICNSIGSFSADKKTICYGSSLNNTIKKQVKRCFLSKGEASVEWINAMPGNSSNDTLPDKILMEIPLGNETAKLEFVKKVNYTNSIPVVTNTRGRSDEWLPEDSEKWDVYSDIKNNASLSLVTKMVNGTKVIFYDGIFVANNTRYQIRLDSDRRGYPFNGPPTKLVVINDTDYLVSQAFNNANPIDNRGRQAQSDGDSMLTTLERMILKKESKPERNEQGGSMKKNYGIELLIVIDYSIFYKWYMQSSAIDDTAKRLDAISNIRYFYTHIVSGINDRYMSIVDSEAAFYVKVVGYSIAMSPDDSQFTEKRGIKVDGAYATLAYKALDEFEVWVQTEATRPGNKLPSFDSAALFTDYEMKAPNQQGVLYTITGLANIGMTCTLKGVSINKDYGQYATIETASHEIGHNLGALHDGSQNSCNPADQYIMASSPGALSDATFYNPYTFSSCSIQYFKDYIRRLDSNNNNCLLNVATNMDSSFEANLKTLPGQKYDVDMQCRLLFGSSSFYCAGGGERDSLICKSMSCWDAKTSKCYDKIEQRALDGTPCGNGAWCIRSTCTRDANALVTPDTCIYGDMKAPFSLNNVNVNCQWMIQNAAYRCYEDYFNKLCCKSCKDKAVNAVMGCEWGDKLPQCSTLDSISCYDQYWKDKCCARCKQFELDIPVPNCRYGNKADWCKTIQGSGCYSASDVCCKTCASLTISDAVVGCEYGDKRTGCTPDYCRYPLYWDQCCRTCQSNITGVLPPTTTSTSTITSTTTSTTTTTTKIPTTTTTTSTTTKPSTTTTTTSTTTTTTKIPTTTTTTSTTTKPSTTTTTTTPIPTTTTTTSTTFIPTRLSILTTTSSDCPRGDQAYWCFDITAADCYGASVTCCDTCKKFYKVNGPEECKYGDKADWCPSYVQSAIECQNSVVASTCCHSCSIYITPSSVIPSCPNGDQSDYCKLLKPWECYYFKSTCCGSCSRYYDMTIKNCEYGDRVDWCESYIRGADDCKRPEVAQYCCKTCDRVKSNALVPACKDAADWCKGMFMGFCYDPSVRNSCCATCAEHRLTGTENCQYGDRQSWCTRNLCSLNAQDCCKTCA